LGALANSPKASEAQWGLTERTEPNGSFWKPKGTH